MDVILAVEGMWVALTVLDTLDLNGRVVEVVFSAAHVRNCRQCLQWLDGLNVNRHGDLALGNGPDVEIMDVDDVLTTDGGDILAQLVQVESAWGTFHHDVDAVLDDGDCRDENDDREQVGAHWVHPPEVGV